MYEDMTVAQLQAEIAKMQAEISLRLCGDPRGSVMLPVCNCGSYKRGESTGGGTALCMETNCEAQRNVARKSTVYPNKQFSMENNHE